MGYTKPYTAYKETGIKTASKGKLVVMLYEGALRNINLALALFDAEKSLPTSSIEHFHNHIVKSQEIITELMVSLNMVEGGEIAQNLMSLYRFFNRELIDISLTHDFDKLKDIARFINELYNTWRFVVANPAMNEERVALNVNG